MYCDRCGKTLQQGNIFCPNCGAPVQTTGRRPIVIPPDESEPDTLLPTQPPFNRPVPPSSSPFNQPTLPASRFHRSGSPPSSPFNQPAPPIQQPVSPSPSP